MASLPPSSSTDGISLLAHASAIRRPVATLPVKNTFAGPASMIAAPTSPPPCRICTRPFGNPARSIISPTSAPVAGVSSEGFSSTALPATRAGINSVIGIANGKFQGEIIATTPCGSNSSQPDLAFSATLWCGTRSGRSQRGAWRARKSAVSSARSTSARIASARGLPVSRVTLFAMSSRRSKIMSRSLRSIAHRSFSGCPAHVFCAARPVSKIAGIALTGVAGMRATTSPVAGFTESTKS